MEQAGFQYLESRQYLYYKFQTIHLVFVKAPQDWIARLYTEHLDKHLGPKLEAMKELGDQEVIVWGCGDICQHLLTLIPLNVKYFVDKNPAFIDARMMDREVYQSVRPGDQQPIVVIAQGQKQDIIDNVKREGLTNQVIVI
jgi:hypothetical protein